MRLFGSLMHLYVPALRYSVVSCARSVSNRPISRNPVVKFQLVDNAADLVGREPEFYYRAQPLWG